MAELRPTAIHGYCDRLSVAPGEPIEFKVSSEEGGTFRADIVRLIHGDTNPAGPGFMEEVLETEANGDYPARFQATDCGSCVVVDDDGALALDGPFTLHAFVMPTTPGIPGQGIMGRYATDSRSGYALVIEDGGLALRVDGETVATRAPFHPWCWYSVAAIYDGAGSVTLYSRSVVNSTNSLLSPIVADLGRGHRRGVRVGRPGGCGHVVHPRRAREGAGLELGRRPPEREDRQPEGLEPGADRRRDRCDQPAVAPAPADGLVAAWDFADGIGPKGIPTDRVTDTRPARPSRRVRQLPRARDDRLELAGNRRGLHARARASTERSTSTTTISRTAAGRRTCRGACPTTSVQASTRSGCSRETRRTGSRSSSCLRAERRPRRRSSSSPPRATSPMRTSTSSTTSPSRSRSSATRR